VHGEIKEKMLWRLPEARYHGFAMKWPTSIGLILSFWFGFQIAEYRHAKHQQMIESQKLWVKIINRKKHALRSDTALQRSLDEIIRLSEKDGEGR